MFKNGLIIAGGTGSRMKPLTDYTPKPLVKYKNRELITYNLELLKKNNIENIITTYGYKSEQLVIFLEKKVNTLINTINKDNSYFLFNTIIKYIDEPILVLPCDLIIDIDLDKLYDEYISLNQPPCVIIPVESDKQLDGDYINHDGGKITSINRTDKSNLYASGIQIINPKKINTYIKPSDNFYNVWLDLINNKQLYISNTKPNYWESVDNFEQIK